MVAPAGFGEFSFFGTLDPSCSTAAPRAQSLSVWVTGHTRTVVTCSPGKDGRPQETLQLFLYERKSHVAQAGLRSPCNQG